MTYSLRHIHRGLTLLSPDPLKPPNGSWNDCIVLYLKDCGVTDEEISKFRRLMLED